MSIRTMVFITVMTALWAVIIAGLIMHDQAKNKAKTNDELDWDRLEAADASSNIVTISQLGPAQKGYTFYEVFNHNHRYLLIASPSNSITVTECK